MESTEGGREETGREGDEGGKFREACERAHARG